ncbi:MAG: transcriptional regulator, partial [Pseudomonadota bacterium]
IGPVKNWFKTHMILGVVGPLAILYHSNFQLGSLNSTVALVSMLLVASSGLVGRILYTRIHHGLFGRKKELKELIARVKLTTASPCPETKFVPDLMEKIAEYDQQVMSLPKGLMASFILPMRLFFMTRLEYYRLSTHISRTLKAQAKHSPVVKQHRRRMKKACKRYVADHLRKVRRVAEFTAYDRLFALWHKVHLPFFVLLLITAIVHVVAVHWYAV